MFNNDENNIEIASVDEIIMPEMPDLPQVDVPEDAVEDIAIEEAAESVSEIQPSSEPARDSCGSHAHGSRRTA